MSINGAMALSRPLRINRSWPICTAIAVYAVVFAIQLCQVLHLTHGHQLYPLDDVYIHAAVAKNLLLHHVYGVTRFNFSFPSSSILWPFVLMLGFAVVGVKAGVPLALNFVFAILYLLFADHFLRLLATSISPRMRLACLLLLVFGVPLVGLSFEGMEHVLHALSFLLLLYCYNRQQVFGARRWRILLAVAAAFAVSLRYESLFAVLVVELLLMWRREWSVFLLVGLAAVAPVVAFGLFAMLHGSTFLPAPLLLKTSISTQVSIFTAVRSLFSTYAVLGGISVCFISITALLLCFVRKMYVTNVPLRDLLAILFGAFLLHAQFANFGWLFRYEAYLLSTSVVLAFAATAHLLAGDEISSSAVLQTRLKVGLVMILALALGGRGASMLRGIPRNAQAIYEQQYQTARFLATYYPGQVIGLNDIGAPDFYADIRTVDLLGLASSDVAHLRRSGRFSRDAVADLAQQRGIRIAALYPGLFENQIPRDWKAVSTFDVSGLPGKVQLGERRVTVYATSPSAATELAEHIEQFRSQLPQGVRITEPGSVEALEPPQPSNRVVAQENKLLAWFHAGITDLTSASLSHPGISSVAPESSVPMDLPHDRTASKADRK